MYGAFSQSGPWARSCNQKQTETTIQYSLPSKTNKNNVFSAIRKQQYSILCHHNNSTGFSAIRNKQKQQYSLPSETIQYFLPPIKIVKSLNFTEQDSRLLYYLIREIKTWLNINHITMYTITHISYFKTQRTVIENT